MGDRTTLESAVANLMTQLRIGGAMSELDALQFFDGVCAGEYDRGRQSLLDEYMERVGYQFDDKGTGDWMAAIEFALVEQQAKALEEAAGAWLGAPGSAAQRDPYTWLRERAKEVNRG